MPAPSVDSATFRSLLASFASGVTVLTTRDGAGAPAGMTASAFCSLSLDPPLVLVCVGHASGLIDALQAAPRFAVNVLAEHQAVLAERFAGARSERFTGIELVADDGDGPPLIGGTAAWLVCETTEVLPGGDHAIFVARVLEGRTCDRAPLVHHDGRYRRLAP